ncbi:acyl-CoA dehydrogenase family protein [Ramlibacter sp. AN1015]|uniref:acyl-CoA dehydrogenase family protein n=1 Tax=Ramlibacter sp. AN1015 TaxID=3133428 RepID=UPI0030BB1310
MREFAFPALAFPPEADRERLRARAFLEAERDAGRFVPHKCSWTTYDPAFSRRAAQQGFVAMTWPKEWGGHAHSPLVRFAVTEEMLAAGAPCGAHWIADRQSGPLILRHGSDAARKAILPRIAAGECYFAIGMSEPDTGSDLAGVRTRATRREGGWAINGSKIWTTNGHLAHYMLTLVRTSGAPEDRQRGLSQFIVELKSPGITMRPILDMAGRHEFNQIFFDDVFVPDEMLVGREGEGWAMVTSELTLERSGPDRFLSDYRLLVEGISAIGPEPDRHQAVAIGRLVAHLLPLRRMSASIAAQLAGGTDPSQEAALVKEMGTNFEREVPEVLRTVLPLDTATEGDACAESYADVLLSAPSFTLRGGTREIMRGVIARGLGLR